MSIGCHPTALQAAQDAGKVAVLQFVTLPLEEEDGA
jgi:hypothetical protein